MAKEQTVPGKYATFTQVIYTVVSDFKKINYQQFFDHFLTTDLGQKILSDYNALTCNSNSRMSMHTISERFSITPRQLLGDPNLTTLPQPKFNEFSVVPFYYIEILNEKQPTKIFDLGCGWNIFKKYYPNIIGLDLDSAYADIHKPYSLDFVNLCQNKLEAIISINMTSELANDGTQTNLENITQHIQYFGQLLKPGGRAYLGLNSSTIIRNTPKQWFVDQKILISDFDQLDKLVEQKILATGFDIIALDVETDVLFRSHSHDGDIRMVFERKNNQIEQVDHK